MVQSRAPAWRLPLCRHLLLVLATAAVASAFGPPAFLLRWKFNVTDAHTFPSWLELAAPPAVAAAVDGSGEALIYASVKFAPSRQTLTASSGRGTVGGYDIEYDHATVFAIDPPTGKSVFSLTPAMCATTTKVLSPPQPRGRVYGETVGTAAARNAQSPITLRWPCPTTLAADSGMLFATVQNYTGSANQALCDHAGCSVEIFAYQEGLNPPTLLWSAPAGTPPAVSGSTVFYGSDPLMQTSAFLQAVDKTTGEKIWAGSLPQASITPATTPVVVNDVVYAGGDGGGDGGIYGFFDRNGQPTGSVATAGCSAVEQLAVATLPPLAPNGQDRSLIFATASGCTTNGTRPTISNETDGSMFAFDAATGELAWRSPLLGGCAAPVIVDGRDRDLFPYHSCNVSTTVLICGDAENIYAACAETGDIVWQQNVALTPGTTVAVLEGGSENETVTVWAGSSDYKLYALDIASGDIMFSYATSGAVGTPIKIQAQGVETVVGSSDGWVYAFGPLTPANDAFGPMDGPHPDGRDPHRGRTSTPRRAGEMLSERAANALLLLALVVLAGTFFVRVQAKR